MQRRMAIGGLLASALPASPGGAAEPERTRIKLAVGGKAFLFYLPLTVAERLDLFRKNGIDVEIFDFAGGAKSLQAVIGGSADLLVGGFDHILRMQALRQLFRSLVVTGRTMQIAILVRADLVANVASIKDLAGQTMGVTAPGSTTQVLASVALVQGGLPANGMSFVGLGATTAPYLAAMSSKRLAAVSATEPVITILEARGLARVLIDTRSVAGNAAVFGGPVVSSALYAPQTFIDRNPVTAERLTRAMVQALKWLETATPDQVADLVPAEFLGGDRDAYRKAFLAVRESYSPDGLMPPTAPANTLRALQLIEPELTSDRINLDATFTDAFVRRAGVAP